LKTLLLLFFPDTVYMYNIELYIKIISGVHHMKKHNPYGLMIAFTESKTDGTFSTLKTYKEVNYGVKEFRKDLEQSEIVHKIIVKKGDTL
jgi:hypothetical protein